VTTDNSSPLALSGRQGSVVRGQHPLHAFTPSPGTLAYPVLIESRYLTRRREDAKWGTHHCEARENGDTPSGADCRLPANPTTPVAHLASAPSVSVRVFAASREPNSSEGPPLRALRGRGYRGGGTGDTAPGIPPDQPRWLLPCSEIRNSSREVAKCEVGDTPL
jgi:hypothetical protein